MDALYDLKFAIFKFWCEMKAFVVLLSQEKVSPKKLRYDKNE